MKTETKVVSHKKHILKLFGLCVVVLLLCVGVLAFQSSSTRIKIDKSSVTGNVISISSATPGTLEELFVHEGDLVSENFVVARVDQTLIRTNVRGLVTSILLNAGTRLNSGQPILTIVDPRSLRVVGQLDENKGLNEVRVGQQVLFTVDAFGSKQYEGVVDELSPVSHESGIVFNISDKRETKTFNVFVRFNVDAYPELKQGMSVRVSIVK